MGLLAPRLLSVSAVAAPGSGTYVDEVLADGPVAYWRCGEASGNLADSSGNSRTMTATGTPSYGVTGLQSSDSDDAVGVDSSGYFVRTDTTLARLASAWTIECLLQIDGGVDLPSEGALVSAEYDGSYVPWAIRTGYPNYVQAAFYNSGWKTAASSTLSRGGTYHVAATWDGTDLRIYIDGALDATTTPPNSPGSSSGDQVWIGRRWDDSTNLTGILDEVAIYDFALSAGRIAAHAAAA